MDWRWEARQSTYSTSLAILFKDQMMNMKSMKNHWGLGSYAGRCEVKKRIRKKDVNKLLLCGFEYGVSKKGFWLWSLQHELFGVMMRYKRRVLKEFISWKHICCWRLELIPVHMETQLMLTFLKKGALWPSIPPSREEVQKSRFTLNICVFVKVLFYLLKSL